MPLPIGPRPISTSTSPGLSGLVGLALDRGDRVALAW